MPRIVKGTPQEREQYMAEIFRKYYQANPNTLKDLSIDKANIEFRKKYGSMLRNKKSYEIRDSVKAQVKAGQAGVSTGTVSANRGHSIAEAASQAAEGVLIQGTADQISWFQSGLELLVKAGLAHARIDHSTSTYAVVVKN